MNSGADTARMARALQAIEQLQEKLARAEAAPQEPIAIVGLGCRLPGGADDPARCWQMLAEGRDAIARVPADRWDADAYYDPVPATPGKIVSRNGGFLAASPQDFDAGFFGISPKEAASLDPQQRLLLEVSWEALEEAGVVPADWRGRAVGVFVGICGHDYSQRLLGRPLTEIDAYLATGNAHSVAAGRLSYTFGFTGPSLIVDTACSSSLVALHLACQSLRNRECDAALAGGVNRLLSPEFSINFSQARMLAPDGRCKAFDAAADGFTRAEGCGVVVLKRWSDARADGDRVLALIRGSAVNQDGRSGGITVPNGPAQQAVIRQALERARLTPAEIDYVEAHGTGTALGDPIELGALGAVFADGHDAAHPLYVGSLKTNVGHMEAAAGIGGVIKVVLAMRHECLPPHLHFRAPTPHVPWAELPLRVTAQAQPWPAGRPRRAGVSSFGFSGTNAHLVLEAVDPPAVAPATPSEAPGLLLLSAKTPAALSALAAAHAEALAAPAPTLDWQDYCWSAQALRSSFACRHAVVAASAAEAGAQLREFAARARETAASANDCRVAFLYTGQGAQYARMAQGLCETEPAFREALTRCAELLRGESDLDLLSLLRGEGEGLDDTVHAQPALFAVAYALAETWRAWGIAPAAVLGHSIGEFAAAVAAGVCELPTALRLIAARGRLMQALSAGGGMLAVSADADELAALLPDGVVVAAINGPRQCVLAGPRAALERLGGALAARGVAHAALRVSHAFHSPAMQPMLADFERLLRDCELRPARLPFYSTVTGERAREALAEPAYWLRQITSPVRFRQALSALAATKVDALIEIGPQPVLLGMSKACLPEWTGQRLPSLARGKPDARVFLGSLGTLHTLGAKLRRGGAPGRRCALPLYPFQRQRHWIETAPPARHAALDEAPSDHPLLAAALPLAHSAIDYHPAAAALHADPLWQEHRVFGLPVLPAAGLLEMALAALPRERAPVLEDLRFVHALPLAPRREVQLKIEGEDGRRSFEILSRPAAGEWLVHCGGRAVEGSATTLPARPLAEIRAACVTPCAPTDCYAYLAARGIEYGAAFRALHALWTGEHEVLSELRLPAELAVKAQQFRFHPVLVDACLQSIAALFRAHTGAEPYLPARLARLVCRVPEARGSVFFSAVRVRESASSLTADVELYAEDGSPLLSLHELELRPATRARLPAAQPDQELDAAWLYGLSWQPAPLAATAEGLAPAALATALAPAFAAQLAQPAQRRYLALLPAFEALARRYARRIVADVAGQPLAPAQAPLAERLAALSALAEDGAPATWAALAAAHAQLRLAHPEAAIELDLFARCAGQLPAVLRGECDPLAVLFPGGDTRELAALYGESPGAQLMNGLVAACVQQALGAAPRSARVLEIGAGTGGTTAALLPLPEGVDYVFTDVSALLVAKARERFGDASGLRYRTLDIEREPAAQGFAPGEFDLMIAANVLHASSDLRRSLAHARTLLKPGGLLVLLESTTPLAWLDMIFGMTRGWWAFTDRELRREQPLLPADAWCALLEEAGFEAALLRPADGADVLASLPQSVLLARARPAAAATQRLLLGHGEESALREAATALDARLIEAPSALRALRDAHSARPTQLIYLALAPELDLLHTDAASLSARLAAELGGLLALLRELQEAPGPAPQLTVVTRGVTASAPASAPLWGLARTLELEHPAFACRRIDLDPERPLAAQWPLLLAELGGADPARTIAYRDGERLIAQLARPTARAAPPAEPFELRIAARGTPDGLAFAPAPRRAPAAGEVEIEVQAAGLNFIDVLDVLGLLPFARDWLGVECAGVVVAVGDGETRYAVGDPVIALAPGSFRQFVTVPAAWVARRPAGMTAQEAATLPANFLTAHYALREVARLRRGERVLIHAAAGGTGMAAVQIARLLGAEIYATASPHKWPALEAMGVQHPMDSRRLDFADQVMRATGGRGVNVVLNSLVGEFVDKSLAVLAPGGRFLEIGKRDLRAPAQRPPGIDYQVVDLMALARDEPKTIAAMFDTLVDDFERGALAPLPRRVFPLTQASEALRCMQRARHVGKLVLDFTRDDGAISPAASYLITGGLGGLGLSTAAWLVTQGARHLALVGRRPAQAEQESALAALRERRAEVRVYAADVAVEAELAAVLDDLAARMPPLKGVIHAAGVLEDGLLTQLEWPRLARALAPKVLGALHLHRLTASLPLDFFVCYASAASLLGSPGQGAHVAANGFLDALAHHRRSRGLPALSIDWGPWSEVGAAAADSTHRQLAQRGIGSLSPAQGLAALAALLPRTELAQIGVVPIAWAQWRRLGLDRDPLFARLAGESAPAATAGGAAEESWRDGLRACPPRQRAAQLSRLLQDELAVVLGLAAGERPSPTLGFFDMGMDSLMSVELKNRLVQRLGIEISSTMIFEHPNIGALAAHLVQLAIAEENLAEEEAAPAQRVATVPATSPEPLPATPPEAAVADALAAELAALDRVLDRV